MSLASLEKLSQVPLKTEYRSDSDDLVQDFYVPCLCRSTLYQRAVGFFTSRGLEVASQGLSTLIKNGGRMELIASPVLAAEDVDAIEKGYRDRADVVTSSLARTLECELSEYTTDRIAMLAFLIASGKLEIRIALASKSASRPHGIYHEKLGLFHGENDECVAFTGSPNETSGGLVGNFEAIDVFYSWDDAQGRVARKKDNFDRLWNNQTKGLDVLDFTECAKDLLQPFVPDYPPTVEPVRPRVYIPKDQKPKLPISIKLRDYQETAIRNWFQNNGRGTLKMATGSGKTITALAAVTKLADKGKLNGLIIVCPFRHLVTQWSRECTNFGFQPILAFEGYGNWLSQLNTEIYDSNSNESDLVSVITTNSTFVSDKFQGCLRNFPERSLIIADEAHNMGSDRIRRLLPDKIPWRLALSATPERWFDDHGTQAIFDYFGEVLEPEFTLRDAIKSGALVEYRYHPMLITLTLDEQDQYCELSERISKLWHLRDAEDNAALTILLSQRARLVGVAANKQTELRRSLEKKKNDSHILVYCGDGSLRDEDSNEQLRHVEAVCHMMGVDLGMRVATYTHQTTLHERERIREQLDSGELQAVIAIRCLDEGVDIPSIKTAYILASSTNPRQFIQRRGRVLRKHPSKKVAEIYDTIVVPPDNVINYESERSLFRKELNRFAEFANIALNSGEARELILPLQQRFGSLDI
jgi:DNA phosphorothioation system restriction enzyme